MQNNNQADNQERIEQLRTETLTQCQICLIEIEETDETDTTPCNHKLHKPCYDLLKESGSIFRCACGIKSKDNEIVNGDEDELDDNAIAYLESLSIFELLEFIDLEQDEFQRELALEILNDKRNELIEQAKLIEEEMKAIKSFQCCQICFIDFNEIDETIEIPCCGRKVHQECYNILKESKQVLSCFCGEKSVAGARPRRIEGDDKHNEYVKEYERYVEEYKRDIVLYKNINCGYYIHLRFTGNEQELYNIRTEELNTE